MLTDLQKKKLTRYFRVYDVDDNGAIGTPDFDRVLENLRVLHGLSENTPAMEELRGAYTTRWERICSAADVDHDGSVTLEEWLAYWEGILEDDARFEQEVAALTQRLFSLFDVDEDGTIGPDEFCDFFGAYGLSAALARQIFLDLDLDGDGTMSRSELTAMAHDFYRSDDPHAPGNRLFGPLE
ncbi:MAG: EF-hand domain-containing protein [Gemmatimonadota bacterium]